MSQINYSFIIPHKDIPDLLRRCVASIPRRDDIEIIIVDDASDTQLVNEHTMADVINQPCVRMIFTTENGGASFVRNVGVREAVGKWIFIADADDFLMPGAIEMLDKYRYSDADVVCFHVCGKDCYTLEPDERGERYNKLMDQASVGQISLNMMLSLVVTTWTKMVQREFYINNDIRFQEDTRILTDIFWSRRVALEAKCIEISPDVLYCVTERSTRMSRTYVSELYLKQMYHVTKTTNKMVVSNGRKEYAFNIEFVLTRIHKHSLLMYWKYYFLCFFDGTLYYSIKKFTNINRLRLILKYTKWLFYKKDRISIRV